jgi:hypothetical protein
MIAEVANDRQNFVSIASDRTNARDDLPQPEKSYVL